MFQAASWREGVGDEHDDEVGGETYKNTRPGVMLQSLGFLDMAIDDPAGNRIIFCTESPT